MIIGNFERALKIYRTNLVVIFMTTTLRHLSFLLAFFLSIPVFSVLGQDVKATWGEAHKQTNIPAKRLIGRDIGGFYLYRQNKETDSSFLLEYYQTSNYQPQFSIVITLPDVEGKSTTLEQIFFLNDHFLLFTSFYDKKTSQNRAFATLLAKDGTTVKSMFEVDRIQNVDNKKNTGTFGFKLSPDSNFVMVFHNTPYRANDNARISLKMFNPALNALWQKKFKLPYSDQDFELVTALVDNQESVYMVCKLNGRGILRADEINANRKYVMFQYNHQGRKLTEYEISVAEQWIHSARFELLNDTTLLVGGFYSGTGQGNISGAFSLSFNTRSGQLINHGFASLPREKIVEISYNDDLIFGGIAAFELRKMLSRDDGGLVLVAEKTYVRTTTSYDPYTGQRFTNYYYHNDDILAVSLSANGDMEWTTILPKNQVSSIIDDSFSSIATNIFADNVYVLYNDHPSNIGMPRKPGEMRTLNNFAKSTPVVAVINRNGVPLFRPISPPSEGSPILRPGFSREYHVNRQIIYGLQSGKDKFGEIFYPSE